MDMRTMMALRRVKTPTTPITKSNAPKAKYKGRGTTASSISYCVGLITPASLAGNCVWPISRAQHLDQLPAALRPPHWLWCSYVRPGTLLLQSCLACQEDGTHHGSKQDQRGNLKGQHKIGKQQLT